MAKKSLPSRERGLKFALFEYVPLKFLSLPSRERGLKYFHTGFSPVDEKVAPLAGAWVEIVEFGIDVSGYDASLPSRERGLKCMGRKNCLAIALSLPSRERGLK